MLGFLLYGRIDRSKQDRSTKLFVVVNTSETRRHTDKTHRCVKTDKHVYTTRQKHWINRRSVYHVEDRGRSYSAK